MKTPSVAKLAVRFAVLSATLLACFGAEAEDAMLQGVFVNPTQPEAPIKAAIETAVKDFNFIARPIARSRLKKTNSPIKRVEIGRNGKAVAIGLDSNKPIATEPGAAPIKWKRDDGEVFDVSTEWQGPALVQTFVAPDGKRVNHYSLSADGMTITMHVTLTSPQLDVPVQYDLHFKRQ